MKLSDLGIIFSCVFLCFAIIWGINTVQLNCISNLNIRYNQAVDNAVTDALYMFVELDDGENLQYNIEESKEQFFRTLGINLNMNIGLEGDRLEEYVPILCYLLPEGFYIYHNEYNFDKSNKSVREYTVSELYNYYREDKDYEYCFMLSDEIWIRDKKTMEIYQGKPEELSNYCNIDFLNNRKEYETIKKTVIVESIVEQLKKYANKYNLHGKEFGIEYEFNIPDMNDGIWVRTIEEPGILAFVQGMPYGGNLGYFNKIAFGGARLYKKT